MKTPIIIIIVVIVLFIAISQRLSYLNRRWKNKIRSKNFKTMHCNFYVNEEKQKGIITYYDSEWDEVVIETRDGKEISVSVESIQRPLIG